MPVDWAAHYLDGRSPVRHAARVHLTPTGLQITVADTGAALWWPLAEVRQTQGTYADEPVRLERGGDTAEVLLMPNVAFLSALREAAPSAAGAFHDPRRRRFRVQLTLLVALATVGLALALHFWVIPTAASLVAARVPVAWEASLGEAVLRELAPPARRCVDPARQGAIDAIMARLLAAAPGQPYRFRVTVVNHPMVNALAAPGGAIIVFRGLLERTTNPEMLAGVLAHEVQHVLRRHATKLIFQRASTGILIAAVLGDVSGVMAYGVETARTLGDLRYSREFEVEADTEGLRLLLAARVDPRGMLGFYEELERQDHGAGAAGALRYLRSHPPTGDRVRTLGALVAGAPRVAEPLLPDFDWKDVRAICGAPARR